MNEYEKLYGPGIMVKTKDGVRGYMPDKERGSSDYHTVIINGIRTKQFRGTITKV